MLVPAPLVIFVTIIIVALVISLYHLGMEYIDTRIEKDRYKRFYDDMKSIPPPSYSYSYSQLVEEMLKAAQPIPIKIDEDIRKLVNLAIDPHANYNEASNAAMQACKRLARKG